MIFFLFSFKQVGGVPTLFYNLARGFIRQNVDFTLIAYKDSVIHDLFEKLHSTYSFWEYSEISNDSIEKKIKKDDVIIITWWDPKLKLFAKVNPNIIFWNVFPDTLKLSNQIRGKFLLKKKTKLLIEKMIFLNGLILMDDAPFNWFAEFNLKKNYEILLPIPICIENNWFFTSKKETQTLRISYIGRAEEWKIFPLLKIINDISNLGNVRKSIVLNVITDNILRLKETIDKIKMKSNKLQIRYFDNIPNGELSGFLLENTDLNIGMGTALLESAKIGIPSLMIDPSNVTILDNYRYRWLYETKNYNLGDFYCQDKDYPGALLVDILLKFDQSKYIDEQSIRCFEYVKNNHNLEKITIALLSKITSVEHRVKDVIGQVFVYRYRWLKEILSCRKYFLTDLAC